MFCKCSSFKQYAFSYISTVVGGGGVFYVQIVVSFAITTPFKQKLYHIDSYSKPSDFLSKATELCKFMGCSSVIYDIYDPQDSEHTELTFTDPGYAE